MPEFNAGQLLLQSGLSFCFCLLLWLAGSFVLSFVQLGDDGEENDYTGIFYRMLCGILVLVLLYSVYKTSFKTVYVLLLPAAFFYIRIKKPGLRLSLSAKNVPWKRLAELFLLCGMFCLLYNFLPESEYKQKDSFFYLKIAESLNRTGQENLHQYYNLLDTRYHGVEPYHYLELWLGALLLNVTEKLLPNIQSFRIVMYTLLSVTFITGLFHLYRVVTGAGPGIAGKLVCFSFIFFMPDLYPYFPAVVNRYLVFNFENNFLERPNERVVYLFLLPVITGLFRQKFDRPFLFFLLCLCLVHPLVYMVLVPVALSCFILYCVSGAFRRGMVLPQGGLAVFFLVLALCPVFYFLFSPKGVAVPYHTNIQAALLFYKRSYKYVALTIATSLLYAGLLCSLAWLMFRFFGAIAYRSFLKENKPFVLFAIIVTGCSIVMARAFDFMENAYQLAYTGYIMASVFIFCLLVLLSRRGLLLTGLVLFLFLGGYAVSKYRDRQAAFVNIFLQNGRKCYGGTPYSAVYLDRVMAFMKTAGAAAGAYVADSGYYRDLYYSNHNPVVYHLPVTYIISNNVMSNIDYCASDTDAVYYGTTGEGGRNAYLANGIARSFFHNGFMPGGTGLSFDERLGRFIDVGHLHYLVVTKDIYISTVLLRRVSQSFTDESTGERFLILKQPAS